jgi:hypothetical protein
MSPSLELRPPQRRARLRLGRRSGASSRDRDGLSVPLRPAFVLASSPSSLGFTAVSLCPVSDVRLAPATSARGHRQVTSMIVLTSNVPCPSLSLHRSPTLTHPCMLAFQSHPESPPPTSIREHRRRSSRVSVSSPRGCARLSRVSLPRCMLHITLSQADLTGPLSPYLGRIRSMVAVVQVLSSVSVCPGTAHAPVRVDVSSTTKMLRLATLVRLAIIWQSSSSSGSTW